ADGAAAEAPLSPAEDPEYPESLLQLEAMIEWVKKSDPGGWAKYCAVAHELASKPRPIPEEAGRARLSEPPRSKEVEESYVHISPQNGTHSWIARGRTAREANDLEIDFWTGFRSRTSSSLYHRPPPQNPATDSNGGRYVGALAQFMARYTD